MTNRSNDDIANALRGLSSGDHAEPDPAAPSGDVPAAAPSPAAPSSVPTPTPAPPAAAQFRTGPAPVLPKRPTPQPQPRSTGATGPGGAAPPPSGARASVPGSVSRAPRPSHPAAPQSPTPRPASPGPRQPAPGSMNLGAPPAPVAPPAAQPADGFVTGDETTNVQPLDDDDVVIVPAAPLSSLGYRPPARPARAAVPMFKTLAFRRTAIPILLTAAAVLLGTAVLKFVVHPDSVLALMPQWVPIALGAVALVFLLVALLNMVQVRKQLRPVQPGAAPAPAAPRP